MQLKELSDRYLKESNLYNSQEKQIRDKIEMRIRQIERLEKKCAKLGYGPFWGDYLVKPIAEKLLKHFPGYHYELLGPFGICCEFAIHFYKNGVSEKEETVGDNCKSITFIPGNLSEEADLGIRDYSKNMGEFRQGTMGEINGMNHPTIKLSPDTEIEDLLKYVN